MFWSYITSWNLLYIHKFFRQYFSIVSFCTFVSSSSIWGIMLWVFSFSTFYVLYYFKASQFFFISYRSSTSVLYRKIFFIPSPSFIYLYLFIYFIYVISSLILLCSFISRLFSKCSAPFPTSCSYTLPIPIMSLDLYIVPVL